MFRCGLVFLPAAFLSGLRRGLAALLKPMTYGGDDPIECAVFIEFHPLVVAELTGRCTIIEFYRNRMDKTLWHIFRVLQSAFKLALYVTDFLYRACRKEHNHKVRVL